jgi:hypothetical protein
MSDIKNQNLDDITLNKCLLNNQLSPIFNDNDNYCNIDFNSGCKLNIDTHKNDVEIPRFSLNITETDKEN